MSFPMRPWFRVSGQTLNHFLLVGAVGSCPKEVGARVVPSLPRARKRLCGGGSCLEPRQGHLWDSGGSRRGRQVSGSWLCREWPWTDPLPALWASFCLCQVLESENPPTSSNDHLGSVLRQDWTPPATTPCQRVQLSEGLGFPSPPPPGNLRMFLRKLSQALGNSEKKGQAFSCFPSLSAQLPLAWLLKSQAPFSAIQQ